MKKKEKVVKDPWCPLTGDIGPNDNLILRARELWGVAVILKDDTYHAYMPGKAAIEKAQRIYDRWDEYNHDPLRIEMLEFDLSMVLDPGRRKEARDKSLQELMRLFYRIDKSLQELRMLSDKIAKSLQEHRRLSYKIDESVKPVVIDVSEQEVFSILAIYEARVSKNPEWPLELLTIAEKYSPDALLGKDRRVQVKNWGLRRWVDTNSDSEKAEWLKMGKEYREKHPDKKLHSSRWVAKNICVILNLPKKSFQTVYKHLLKNNV